MAQISRRPVKKDVEKRVYKTFTSVLSRIKDHQLIEEFLNDFLSPVEKIMLSKRLSIALLLGKGYTYQQIAEILHVTPPTIAKVGQRLKYTGQGYKKIVNKLISDEKSGQMFEKLEDFLVTIPYSKGSSIKRQLSEHYKKKRARQKAF